MDNDNELETEQEMKGRKTTEEEEEIGGV